MKKYFTLLFCIACYSSTGQTGYSINFEDTSYRSFITIDTVNYHHNIWQIGMPKKHVFTSAYSLPNAIVTDTLNPYPANDTSVFYLQIPNPSGTFHGLDFEYQVNDDSNAIAKIEVSLDSGITWLNLCDTAPPGFFAYGVPGIACISILTTGWTEFVVENEGIVTNTTILFRFTFATNNASPKDGWIIDNITVNYIFGIGVPEVQNNNIINLYPNPSNGNIYIHANKPGTGNAAVSVFNMSGQEVYSTDKLQPNDYLNLPLPNGNYMLKYKTADEEYVQQIIINR